MPTKHSILHVEGRPIMCSYINVLASVMGWVHDISLEAPNFKESNFNN